MKHPSILVIAALFAFAALLACRQKPAATAADPLESAFGVESDWNNPQHLVPLNYLQTQGKRVFYVECVWCHADATPAGPSNRSNLNPNSSLANDGATLNSLSDDYLQNVITLGGSAMEKSAMMPPWGKTLTQGEIRAVIAYMRAIAQPPYHAPARSASQYSGK